MLACQSVSVFHSPDHFTCSKDLLVQPSTSIKISKTSIRKREIINTCPCVGIVPSEGPPWFIYTILSSARLPPASLLSSNLNFYPTYLSLSSFHTWRSFRRLAPFLFAFNMPMPLLPRFPHSNPLLGKFALSRMPLETLLSSLFTFWDPGMKGSRFCSSSGFETSVSETSPSISGEDCLEPFVTGVGLEAPRNSILLINYGTDNFLP